jgi:uncharacterized protein (DUF302 family)
MTLHSSSYSFGTTISLPFAAAVERTKEALMAQGFGVLTEIDIAATLKKKLDVDFRPYVILGACNPPLAYKALTAEREIGVLLPCNVIVYAGDDVNTSVVSVMDPVPALGLTGRSDISDVAVDVRGRMEKMLAALNGN